MKAARCGFRDAERRVRGVTVDTTKKFATGGMMPTDFKLPAVERGWWKCAKCGRLFESYSNPPIWDEHACLHWEKNTSNAMLKARAS
jgi:hypothetical protein